MSEKFPITVTPVEGFPPPERWDNWTEYDAKAWPRKVERRYTLVPTTCFNCEAACGLIAFVDKETLKIRRLEGNPYHPASRGRNCAKGPATLNQIDDPGRILHPLRRVGERGSGKWEQVSWEVVLDTIAEKIRGPLAAGNKQDVMYHVGRPGADGYMDRVLQAWGVDGHNSHTNVCSAAARLGYAIVQGGDRPSPDHENARFLLLLSSHLETGHYFNPHAQRIIDAKSKGAKIAVVDVRLSNTASMADWWIAPWPGTEAFLILALCRFLLVNDRIDRAYVERWTNWREFPGHDGSFPDFLRCLTAHYDRYTPEAAEAECGVAAETILELAAALADAGNAVASHVWRNAASGNLGGWQVARCLAFLSTLVGAIGAKGGTNLAAWDKFVPAPFAKPPPQTAWNELAWPTEYPLSHHELSYLLPHFLLDGRGTIGTYFTRVYNPVWTNPDGMIWEKVLRDQSLIGLHVALTPTWNETAQYADFVLPMGVGAERHDLQSQETHAARWIAFRQPVRRVAMERAGTTVRYTWEANPGEVWEEDEFWIELSWRIDPTGELGIRRWFESPYRPGQKITVDEYYGWIFEHSVPGLPEAAAREGLTPLAYMRRYGAFLVEEGTWEKQAKPDATGRDTGFGTPSKKLEIWSQTLSEWGWPEEALPGYIRSHIHREALPEGSYALIPTFRLPTLIHTRSGNAKWLYELSNTNPLWVHPEDAEKIGLVLGGLVRVSTRIGYFVNRVWVTEGMRPGVVACSHHLGRWRLFEDHGTDRWASSRVEKEDLGAGKVRFRRVEGISAFKSSDPDSKRVWWTDGGVHQNLVFPVQPDPISGMHCWHQQVRVEPAHPDDRYADVAVDTEASMRIFREWLAKARPVAAVPGALRRPEWLSRAVRPSAAAYRFPKP